jgi:uncharacterized protein (DUF1501 family)
MAFHPTRRALLGGGASLLLWSQLPATALASGRDPRLVTVILRGGLDGIAAVAPVGDPAYGRMREGHTLPEDGAGARLALDGLFALNGRMPETYALWQRGEVLFVHAAHTPYRDRSHFSGQDVLENGTTTDAHHADGWLGRALNAIPTVGTVAPRSGLAVATSVPLILRGSPDVVTWMPPGLPPASDDTRMRLLDLYTHTDPALAAVMEAGLSLEQVAGSEAEMIAAFAAEEDPSLGRKVRTIDETAHSVGRVLSADDGPRVAVLDLSGFDTHRRQGDVDGALGNQLALVDRLVERLRASLAPVWENTVVAIVTEFGRTVRINGSAGTDHGSATVAMLVGGAVAGGRVVADWPGLAERELLDNRDLMPTTDLRAVLKGVLADHLGVGEGLLGDRVFPGSAAVRPLTGLVRA